MANLGSMSVDQHVMLRESGSRPKPIIFTTVTVPNKHGCGCEKTTTYSDDTGKAQTSFRRLCNEHYDTDTAGSTFNAEIGPNYNPDHEWYWSSQTA